MKRVCKVLVLVLGAGPTLLACRDVEQQEGCQSTLYYEDSDGDGFGAGAARSICGSPGPLLVQESGDCDDTNPEVSPIAADGCDGVDNNCDGSVDETVLLADEFWSREADVCEGTCALVVLGALHSDTATQADADDLRCLSSAPGGVRLHADAGLVQVSLDQLETTKNLSLQSPDLTTVSLDALYDAGTSLSAVGPLESFSLGSITALDADLSVQCEGAAGAVAAARLESITGSLHVQGCTGSLSMPALSAVGGDVQVSGPDEVGLDGLVSVGGAVSLLEVSAADTALGALETVAGDLLVEECTGAFSAPALAEVGGGIDLSGVTEADLSGLLAVGGGVVVQGTPGFSAMHLGVLETVGGDVLLSGTALSVLEPGALQSIGGALVVEDNEQLQRAAFGALESAGGLSVAENPALDGLSAEVLSHVHGDLTVASNEALAVLSLPGLESVLGSAAFSDNPSLSSLSAPTLRIVHQSVTLERCAALSAVTLDALSLVKESVVVGGVPALEHLSLPALSGVWSSVSVVDNDALLSLGAPALESVGADLGIAGNPALWSLEMGALQLVGGSLEISDNTALCAETVSALEAQVDHSAAAANENNTGDCAVPSDQ